MTTDQRCPICDAGGLASLETFGEYRLWHCRQCQVQHWTPLVHPQAGYYESEQLSLYAAKHEGAGHGDRRHAEFFAEFGNASGLRVLDVGCSDGWVLSELARRGNDVYGIDIDSRALEVARRRGLTQLWNQPVEEFVSSARARGLTFDLITMFDVLEHTTDPVAVLRDLRTVLAPGGRLAGTVPNRNRLFANLMVTDFPPHHFFRFDEPALTACVDRAGFGLDKVTCFEWGYSGPALVAAARRRIRVLLGRKPEAGMRSRAAEDHGTPTRRSLRSVAARAVNRIAGASAAIEKRLDRGFKLYFVAHPSDESQTGLRATKA